MKKIYEVPEVQVFAVESQVMIADSLKVDPDKKTDEALVKEDLNNWGSGSDAWDSGSDAW